MIMLSLFALATTPPTLPTDFYTGLQGIIATAPGAYQIKDALCCARDAPECSIVTQTMNAHLFEQGSLNRSIELSNIEGNVLQWGDPVRKIINLQPGSAVNSSHKWACASYCPMDDDFASQIVIAPNHEKVTYLGRKTVSQPDVPGGSTQSCDAFGWTMRAWKLLPLSDEVFYVKTPDASSSPVPFEHSSTFTQFIDKLTQQRLLRRSYLRF